MSRKQTVYLVLGAFFVTNAILAEIIGGKLIYVGGSDWRVGPLGPFIMSVGVVLWPVVFITTDLVNEYYGKKGVRRLTLMTTAMIAYAFVVLYLTRLIDAVPGLGIDDASYQRVFTQSQWIIAGSITAFLIAQLIDVLIFHAVRRRTGSALIWLRATGSTVVSQLIDSIVVLYIGLALPQSWDAKTFLTSAGTNYSVKLLIAIAATPMIYLGHWAVERYLGKEVAEKLAEEAAGNGAGAPIAELRA